MHELTQRKHGWSLNHDIRRQAAPNQTLNVRRALPARKASLKCEKSGGVLRQQREVPLPATAAVVQLSCDDGPSCSQESDRLRSFGCPQLPFAHPRQPNTVSHPKSKFHQPNGPQSPVHKKIMIEEVTDLVVFLSGFGSVFFGAAL